jgi:ABC-2 type transport system permease protein
MEDKRLRIMWLAFANIKAYLPEFLIIFASFPIFIAVMFFLWQIIYANANITAMPFETLITYYIITYVLGTTVVQRWSVSERISDAVRNGYMVIYLTRPLDFRTYLFYNSLGTTVFFFAPISIIMTIAAGFFIKLTFVSDPLMVGLFFTAAALSFIFNFLFFLAIGAIAFWAEKTRGILHAVDTSIMFFGGAWIPLSLLPLWVQGVSSILPFKYCISFPTLILLGKLSIEEIIGSFAILIIWILVFYFTAKIVWERGIRRFTGYGV